MRSNEDRSEEDPKLEAVVLAVESTFGDTRLVDRARGFGGNPTLLRPVVRNELPSDVNKCPWPPSLSVGDGLQVLLVELIIANINIQLESKANKNSITLITSLLTSMCECQLDFEELIRHYHHDFLGRHLTYCW